MKFIRLKLNNLRVEDVELNKVLIERGFGLTISLPLPDVNKQTMTNIISHEEIKTNMYEVISFNEFQFTSLHTFLFNISEETFNLLAQSYLTISIPEHNVLGQISMNKLLLAGNYQLKCTVPLVKTVEIDLKKNRRRKADLNDMQDIETHTKSAAGTINIELNLQQGDTDEQRERNYQIKLAQDKAAAI